jgi:hypothetical protein
MTIAGEDQVPSGLNKAAQGLPKVRCFFLATDERTWEANRLGPKGNRLTIPRDFPGGGLCLSHFGRISPAKRTFISF